MYLVDIQGVISFAKELNILIKNLLKPDNLSEHAELQSIPSSFPNKLFYSSK